MGPNSEDFNNLDNNIPNPYDPSVNNNMNISTFKNIPDEPVVEDKKNVNIFEIHNDIFNQDMSQEYNDNMNQSDNYNIAYNSKDIKAEPVKSKMIWKYLLFIAILIVTGIIIYIASLFIK